jgi:hypothetical protein
MIDKKYIELMNREIDDLITPAEKQDLHHHLDEDMETREYYEELLAASQALIQVPEPVIPQNLYKRIINSIDFSRNAHKPKSRWTFNFISGFNKKYVLTFAAGLLTGIFIYALFSMTSQNFRPNDVSGTIGVEEALTIREVPINLGEIQGDISLKEKNDLYSFEISLNSESLVNLTISYPDQVKLESFHPGIPGRMSFITAGNIIKAENSGPQQYTFSFTRTGKNPPPVHIELAKSGKKIFEHMFALNR